MERIPHFSDAETIDEAYEKAGERVLKFAEEVVADKLPVMCFALNPEGGVHAVQIVDQDSLMAMAPNMMLAIGKLLDQFLDADGKKATDAEILLTTIAYSAQQLVRGFPEMDPTLVLRVLTEALTAVQLERRPNMNPGAPIDFH